MARDKMKLPFSAAAKGNKRVNGKEQNGSKSVSHGICVEASGNITDFVE
jgi:hypothetical protein